MDVFKHTLIDKYWHYEGQLLDWTRKIPFLQQYTNNPISSRITLFLLLMGSLAFVNELYITIEMAFVQKETYQELRQRKLDEALRDHKLIVDDTFHGKEFLDEKSGIVIEEFESMANFFAKPVHVAHLFVRCTVKSSSINESDLPGEMTFHVEFSPEEYEMQRRTEFGTSLEVLRRKLYHLFKDTDSYRRLEKDHNVSFSISKNVKIFNTFDEELNTDLDDIQLCFLKLETGDTICCEFTL
ncbi:HFL099Cp [Eremothecium sinecaudum]|uniref:HFL099Cp n=1 Tax=Eremothecium sinecaudum TaxID=45286 RepID=A0A0X8HUG3_9SACH|nr:HFL099Cp [Eremothecium sinecaudum]AMD21757.1 HFL099Cp [Eremothecium sinecaudum]